MFDGKTLIQVIPALPLAATAVTVALGARVLRGRSHWPVILALAAAFAGSVLLWIDVDRQANELKSSTAIGFEQVVPLWNWTAVPGEADGVLKGFYPSLSITVALRIDPLTAVMLVVVTGVSLLVAVYSAGYLRDDPGYWRFFAYLSLFVFSMIMLVSVSNFAMLYVFWEAVGLCSYLLIGFWYHKPEAVAAGKKAFLVNRIGDFGFALAVFLLWTTYGTLDFHDSTASPAPGILGQMRLHDPSLVVGGPVATAICLLLMMGACGKSAQLPLHVWLPDAMEGPTPVSALIHAATMVTAGVYLVARCTPLFAASPYAQEIVAGIGGTTALVAAVIAVTQTDLKRILAYSTISQLGYMFLGMGAGTLLGVTGGMFHLVTHAMFKALLFLAAGSVMHAMAGVIDLERIGGLRRRLPVTYWTFLVGSLALAGCPPFAGFFSKDQILAAVHDRASVGTPGSWYHVLYLGAMATAFLTAFYTFRAVFRTFHGDERIPHEAERHAHESPRVMTVPLVVLAILSAVAGGVLWWTGSLESLLLQTPSLACRVAVDRAAHQADSHAAVAWLSGGIALSGIAMAWLLYCRSAGTLWWLTRLMRSVGLYRLSREKFFFDTIYLAAIVRPLEGIARAAGWFDRVVLDGLVDLVGRSPRAVGDLLRWFQSGLTPSYALAMVLGLLFLLAAVLR